MAEVVLREFARGAPDREAVMRTLEACYDPCCEDRRISVVDMGLIEAVEVRGSVVRVEMVLTSGWCPFTARLDETIREKVGKLPGVEAVEVEIVWDPVWTPQRMSEPAREKLRLPLERLEPLREARLKGERS